MDKYVRYVTVLPPFIQRCLNNSEKEEQQICIPDRDTMDPHQYNSVESKYIALQVLASHSRLI